MHWWCREGKGVYRNPTWNTKLKHLVIMIRHFPNWYLSGRFRTVSFYIMRTFRSVASPKVCPAMLTLNYHFFRNLLFSQWMNTKKFAKRDWMGWLHHWEHYLFLLNPLRMIQQGHHRYQIQWNLISIGLSSGVKVTVWIWLLRIQARDIFNDNRESHFEVPPY